MFDGGMALGKYVLTGDYMRRSIMFDLSYSIVSGYGLFFIFSLFLKGKNFLSNIFIFFILLHLLFLFQFIFNTDINNLKLIYLPNSLFKDSRCIIYISDYRCRHSDDFGCLFIDRYFENEPLYKINDLTVNMVKIKD